MSLEPMEAFFEARVESYDEHMLEKVEGCREGYERMARLLPSSTAELLDLGCGTGLELDAIFRILPAVRVTGIDLSAAMLGRLERKHPDKALTLIRGDYLAQELGEAKYDAAVSFQTMHHFPIAQKVGLYARVCRALRDGGLYLECDYMVLRQEEEDFHRAEDARLRREAGIGAEALFHHDTPCTVRNQIAALESAGFPTVRQCWRQGNTTLLLAAKSP